MFHSLLKEYEQQKLMHAMMIQFLKIFFFLLFLKKKFFSFFFGEFPCFMEVYYLFHAACFALLEKENKLFS
jgi:hypothetical protein